MRSLICSAIALAAAASFAASDGADGTSTPVATGCPAGFDHNGHICALALPESVAEAYCRNLEPGACYLVQLGLPLYQFIEDDNPAQDAGAAILDLGD